MRDSMGMKDHTEDTSELLEQHPATALAGDLADIRALLREAVALGKAVHKGAETRLAAMTAATRLFSAATKGSEIIARLNGHVPQTRHVTVVAPGTYGPMAGQTYDEWWQSLSPERQKYLDLRFNEPWRKYAERQRLAAEGGTPSKENPKTTSPAFDDADDPEET